jgi:flavin-dependent dehydrogenase
MKTEVAIVGAGPGGCASAIYLSRLGIKPIIVEREQYPRFHIGESMTGEAGGVLRELGLEQQMLDKRHPIKHGVSVWGTSGKTQWFVPVMQRMDDGTLREQFTWQVRRSEFDRMMLEAALAAGAELIEGRAREPIVGKDGAVSGVKVQTSSGAHHAISSQVLLDCSGQATWLASHNVTGPKYLGSYDKQVAIFTHVTGFRRDDGGGDLREKQPGNTLIYYKKKYHWAWAIPIDDEVTSVGVVAPMQYFLDSKESKHDYLARELKELNPALAWRVEDIEFVEHVRVIPNYSLQVQDFAGKGFICVGDAHRFVDPIFSFGLFSTLKEAGFVAQAACDYIAGKGRDDKNPFEMHMQRVERAADIFEDMIDSFWENPLAFAWMVHKKHREDVIDIFAGRVFDVATPSAAMMACRELLKRERVYQAGGDYSVPIGSRYKPERAAIWNAELDRVATTESWMRD